jgi:hypothetical protein
MIEWFGHNILGEAAFIAASLVAIGVFLAGVHKRIIKPAVMKTRELLEWVEHVNQVVSFELQSNGGQSMKDRVAKTIVAVQLLQVTLDDHIRNARLHHKEVHETHATEAELEKRS